MYSSPNVVRDSSVGIATRYGWTVRGSNPCGGARFSAPVQTDPGAHPAFYTTRTGSFPVVKRPARGVDYPPPSSAEVKESRTIPLLLLWAFVVCSGMNLRNFCYVGCNAMRDIEQHSGLPTKPRGGEDFRTNLY